MPPKRHEPAKRFDIGEYGSGSAPVEKDASLSWRDDPEETLSDWRIVVEVPALKMKNVYHVHKAMIAGGPRKSDYFVRQCRSGGGASQLAEAVRSESKLDLEAEAAEAIPDFLDYVYTGSLKATKENACALLHLAEYLGNPPLYAEVKDFIEAGLQSEWNFKLAPKYVACSELFNQEKLADAAVQVAAEHLEDYSESVTFSETVDGDSAPYPPELQDLLALHPTLFARIVTSKFRPDADFSGRYGDLSWCVVRLVADYCNRRADIDGSFFESVVDDDFLSHLGSDATMSLLKAVLKHPASDSLTRLRDKCIQKAGEDWQNSLLPLARQEKRRRAEERAAAAAAAQPQKGDTNGKRHKGDTTAGTSTEATGAATVLAPAVLPLGSELPAEIQLQLLGNMLLQEGGEGSFDEL
eukprot:jgi/Chrpa1/26178/Chrysochromulina_OHIO_Genome00001161-RA